MTILDFVLILVASFFMFRGFRRGLINEIAGLIGLAAATLLAMTQYGYAADLLLAFTPLTNPTVVKLISIISVFILVQGLFLFAAFLLRKWFESFTLGRYVNCGGGLIFGLGKISLAVLFLMTFIMYNFPEQAGGLSERSRLLPVFCAAGNQALAGIYYLGRRYPALVNNRFVRDYRENLAAISMQIMPPELYEKYQLLTSGDKEKLLHLVRELPADRREQVCAYLRNLETGELRNLIRKVDNAEEFYGYVLAASEKYYE